MLSVNYATLNSVFKETVYMYLVGQVSARVKNLNIGIFSDTLNVINVKLCMMALRIQFHLFHYTFSEPWLYLKVTSVSDLTDDFMFLSI